MTTFRERRIAYLGYAVGNRDGNKGTVGERGFAYFGHTVRDGDRGKATVALKSRIANRSHAIA